MFGPVVGRRHDAAILTMSSLLDELQQFSYAPNGEALCIYGDLAYPLRQQQCPFRQRQGITAEQQAFNQSMSKVPVSVEWVFGEIVAFFKFYDFKQNAKVGLSPVVRHTVYVLFCMYGSNTANYFGIEPPALKFYLNCN